MNPTPPKPSPETLPPDGNQGFWSDLRANWRHYRARPSERIGLGFALLLLFVPVFYFLLYFRRYSVAARVGWGFWLGLVVYVKLAGLAEPILNVEQELRARPDEASQILANTLYPPEVVNLEDYLRRLGGGLLGRHMSSYQVLPLETGQPGAGEAIALVFRPSERFFDSEESVALSAIEAAFNLMYGRDFRKVQLEFTLHELKIRLEVEREAFNRFFGLTEDEMRELTRNSNSFAISSVATLSPARQREFLSVFLQAPKLAPPQ